MLKFGFGQDVGIDLGTATVIVCEDMYFLEFLSVNETILEVLK